MDVNKISDIYKATKLWRHFTKETSTTNVKMVEELVEYASGILSRIVETFPTYTLHDGQHQLNILHRMEDLLGERLTDLTTFETAILILSAFYHDIGMVFTKEEREKLKLEVEFEDFLNKNPSARLAIEAAKGVTEDIAEWYCRWIHAKRVWHYLQKVEMQIVWDGVNFKRELAEVCLSHNESTDYLKGSQFDGNFLAKADLRFCAILLRLADILDFDNTRSPESVYEYLKLDNPQSNKEKVSHDEWSKHLASQGFEFGKRRHNSSYELDFIAAPKHPAVENDIRDFLDIIEVELQRSSAILNFCLDRWKGFNLPDKISRNNIRSQGYKFGNYKFSLDQQQVLDLLMGENLYDDQFVFIRELLQNSIDTSRDREFHEHKSGNTSFKAKPIEISTWIDSDGARWVRFDDYGMGMDESIINKYFLKVGNSYYNSDEFKVRKLLYKKADSVDFTPISRFGIGVLSCFIVGDRVEVNTKHVNCATHTVFPIRLSLKGLHNFYIMQTDKDTPLDMPNSDKNDIGYRKDYGTSVAVRFKSDKDPLEFDLREILAKVLLNSPVPIILKDVGVVSDYLDIGNQPISANEIVVLNNGDKERIEREIRMEIDSEIRVHVVPISLKYDDTNNINGQVVFLLLECQLPEELNNVDIFRISDTYDRKGIVLKVRNPKSRAYNFNLEINLSEYLKDVQNFRKRIEHYEYGNLLFAHNGIVIPSDRSYNANYSRLLVSEVSSSNFLNSYAVGVVNLKDELRPNVSIARNKIASIPWNLFSAINYVLSKVYEYPSFKDVTTPFPLLDTNVPLNSYFFKDFLCDPLLVSDLYWCNKKIINTPLGFVSVNGILQSSSDTEIFMPIYKWIYYTLVAAILQIHCKVTIEVKRVSNPTYLKQIIIATARGNTTEELHMFPPLTFVYYKNYKGLRPTEYNAVFLNIEHEYSIWFIKCHKILLEKYSTHYWTLIRTEHFQTVNEVLHKLRLILPDEFKPSMTMILSEKDFEVNQIIE